MKKWRIGGALVFGLCVGMLSGGPVFADEIEDSIKNGLEQYKKGSYSEAVTSLNFAAQKIGQIKADIFTSFIPPALPGWTADKVVSQAEGASMFGDGLSVEGRYRKGQQADVTVRIVTGSPLLQSMMMLSGNPAFATASGAKLEKINGQTGVVKYEAQDKQGDINVVAGGKVLVTVEGNGVGLEDLMAYAKAVAYDKIAAQP